MPDVVDGNKGYADIGLDLMRKDDEDRKLFRRAKEQKISTDEVYSQMGHHGVFVILSSCKIAVDKYCRLVIQDSRLSRYLITVKNMQTCFLSGFKMKIIFEEICF